MKSAAIGPIAIHLPAYVETIEQLRQEFPKWDTDLIYEKTGVRERHIAAPDELASDLGVAAAEKLFGECGVDRGSIDFLLFCTQTPDFPLPTTSCLMQHRLKLPATCGALDFNLGCSGFVYGAMLAAGLIQGGMAKRVLLVTAETYSKYIDPADRSLRTIFGDGAAATVIDAVDSPSLSAFACGTDGSGADLLMLTRTGCRPPGKGLSPSKRHRWPSDLYMDGPALVFFTLERIPALIDDVLKRGGKSREDVRIFIMHQATRMLLEQLRSHMKVDEKRMPMVLEQCGNTVSSTIPIVIDVLRRDGSLRPGMLTMLVGFGVGLSWSGCLWTETWDGKRHILP
ncbi:MAG: ketoacyl-ACP synthase III [Planctomycetia bacterium]|nr:ketoacyl-ACP synthase III [Planctomycetia bacterium]